MSELSVFSFMMLTASQRTLQLSSKEEVLEVVADILRGEAGPVSTAEYTGLTHVAVEA